MNNGRPRTRTNRNARKPRSNLRSRVNFLSKDVSGQGVQRIRKDLQLVSIPNHNYQLKMRRMFRVLATTTGSSTQISVAITAIRLAICEELGFDLVTPGITTGMVFTIHGFRVYSTAPSGFASLAVSVFDVEESSTSNASLISLLEDNSTNAGVAHVAGVFSLNNRPTFNRATPENVLLSISVPSGHFLVVDLDATVIRTPTVFPSLLDRIGSEPEYSIEKSQSQRCPCETPCGMVEKCPVNAAVEQVKISD